MIYDLFIFKSRNILIHVLHNFQYSMNHFSVCNYIKFSWKKKRVTGGLFPASVMILLTNFILLYLRIGLDLILTLPSYWPCPHIDLAIIYWPWPHIDLDLILTMTSYWHWSHIELNLILTLILTFCSSLWFMMK